MVFSQQKDKVFGNDENVRRIQTILDHEAEIKDVIRGILPYGQQLEDALKALGAPTTAAELDITPKALHASFLYAKELRPKYVILDLADDLGLLEDMANAAL